MRRLFVAVCLLLTVGVAHAAAPATIETDHVTARFLVRNATTAPGDSTDIAIVHTIAPDWHTYWLNPGDSGEPPIFDFTLEHGGKAGEVRFPAPSRLPYPPLMNYGYEDAFTLLTGVTVPADWPAGSPYPVTVRADWLVCADICIPEGGSATFEIPTAAATSTDSGVAFTFMQAEWALPAESDAAATYSRDDGHIHLTVPIAASAQDTVFFAYDREAIDHVAEQEVTEASDGDGLFITLSAGRGRLDGTLRGVLKTADGAFSITATGDADPEPPTAAAATGPAADGASPSGPGRPAAAPAPALAVVAPDAGGSGGGGGIGLAQAIAFAFIGGLILNLMPCVFPVLALKALSLVSHAGEPLPRRAALAGAYTAGVVAAFMVLTGTLLGLKAAGVSVGWGFQLQSPAFVAAMALLTFAVGLNLSGLFEVGAGLTRFGGRGGDGGIGGSFATGALATVVATPCTAPFMAVAIGAALATSPLIALAVFAALGVGLAAPFVLIALIPGLARILPKPGVWMVRLKQALAFPLYATAAWLVWVLAQIVGVDALLAVLAGAVLLAMAGWLYGLSQRGTGRSHRIASGLAVASLAASLAAIWPAANGTPVSVAPASAAGPAAPFTPDRLAALTAAGRPVLVNATAAWCITCKVNERVVFDTAEFDRMLKAHDVTYLVADWTRRDPDVTRLIERFGRAGVPLYLMFDKRGEATILPQILSFSTLKSAFEKSEI
ncbi:protein-disulfide reductase DsbD family protein [Acuticoccus mangrovi]|uniref:Thioredoxin family protein n=1 Tax=Acuticoccus mangrovi TaxID=2796142 RepID=A0A934ITN4_9HYPH|nr:protein-disulfide reductase DsbD domain-containing protein [Acuticoccus mangrovi]MBJ3778403.1 thioredoxin family protein [Acuticoccus mangrovi]